MIPIDLIVEANRPVAALCAQPLTIHQRRILRTMLPSPVVQHVCLAARWGVAEVLASYNWAAEQLHRKPMLKPRCIRVAFL
jgi:hypothetical protein